MSVKIMPQSIYIKLCLHIFMRLHTFSFTYQIVSLSSVKHPSS